MISPAECARLADRAYREATYRPGGDVQALLVETPGYLALAGRGSEFDFQDWLRNFRAYPWHDWQLGMVHKGYLEAARALWPLVSPRLLDPADSRPRVLLGHSAGGAIVTVIGGLLSSTFLTLLVIPMMIVVIRDFQTLLRTLFKKENPL